MSWRKTIVTALPIVAVVVLSGILARSCNRAEVAEDKAVRLAELSETLRGKFTAATQDAEAAGREAKRLLDADATLQAEVKRLEAAVKGKVKIVTIREGATKPTVALGAPAATLPGCPECLVPVGSLLMARVASLDARTEKGNLVALTHVVVDRVLPEPRTTLLDDTLSVAASSFVTQAPAPERARWSLGGSAWWTNPGWTAEARGGMRLAGDFWLEAAARFDNQYAAAVRWEFR